LLGEEKNRIKRMWVRVEKNHFSQLGVRKERWIRVKKDTGTAGP